MNDTRTRRGRPPAPVTDLPPPDGYTHNPETRIGWLLRGWRLVRLPGSNARKFADLLVERGVSADASRVSRWETGMVPAPIEVVEAYEDILGLPAGGLLGATTYQRRMASGRRDQPIGYGPDRVRAERVEQVLDVVHDGEPTGRDWFELGMTASTLREQLVLPRSVWRRITARLVTEVGRSVGNAYIARLEGAILFTGHPGASRALVHAIGEHVTSPDNLLLTDPMSLLQEIEAPQANDLVLRLLEQPTPLVRNGAAWACASKVVRGHFSPAELLRLEATVAHAVQQQGYDEDGTFSRLRDLVEVLPGPARERVLGLAERHGVRRYDVPDRDTQPTDVARAIVQAAGARRGSDDPMYVRLVERAIWDDHAEMRFLSAFTLKVSARHEEAAVNCAEHVRRHVDGEVPLDRETLHRLMMILSILGEEPQRDLLLRLAHAPDVQLQPMAIHCLGHLPDTARLGVPGLREIVHDDHDPVARAALYCAGMTGDPLLAEAADDLRLADWKRRAARWWLKQDGAIHEPPPGETGTTR